MEEVKLMIAGMFSKFINDCGGVDALDSEDSDLLELAEKIITTVLDEYGCGG